MRYLSAGFAVCLFLPVGETGAVEQVRGQAQQGDLMVFKVEAGTQIRLDGVPLAISSLGYFAFGFHRDDKRLSILIFCLLTVIHSNCLTPQTRTYDIQRIDNLPMLW